MKRRSRVLTKEELTEILAAIKDGQFREFMEAILGAPCPLDLKASCEECASSPPPGPHTPSVVLQDPCTDLHAPKLHPTAVGNPLMDWVACGHLKMTTIEMVCAMSPKHSRNESARPLRAPAICSRRKPYLGMEHLVEVLRLSEPAFFCNDRRRQVRLRE